MPDRARQSSEVFANHAAPPSYSRAPSFASNALLTAPSNVATNVTSSSQATLTWDAPGGTVNHYQIERGQSLSGPFSVIGTSVSTSFNDTTVTAVNSYLYRVRAIDSFGAPSPPSNVAMATAITFLDPTLTANVTQIKAQHIYDLRQAVNAVRAIGGLTPVSWTPSTLVGQPISASDIQVLRVNLDPALNALSIPTTAYEDSTLYTGANGTLIRKIHIEQLRDRSTRRQSTSSGPPDGGVGSAAARLDPMNRTGGGGEDPLSRNFNFVAGLVGLPGRAGLDLSLSLSYNSLATWTKSGTYVSFDDDFGFPAPGFRLGFPVIQAAFYNAAAAKNSFIMISPSGARVELRQVGTSNLYQSVDSSYLLLDASTMTLKSPDGTQLAYSWQGSAYQCTQIKDRNGNLITIAYDAGRIDTIVDTLSRTIKFNYTNGDLTSITQTWTVNGQQQPTHTWATFTYANQTIQTNFTGGLTVIGPQNNTTIRVLTKVAFPDYSHFDFDYTSWGQVWKIRQYAPGDHLLNYHSYDLPLDSSTAQTDCPRFTQRRDWAANWNRDSQGNPQEVTTGFAIPTSATIPETTLTGTLTQVTFPDLTFSRIYFGSSATSPGWQNGLPLLSESYDVTGPRQRWSIPTWTQDDPNLSYQLNPRVIETNVYDPSNRARTKVDYATFNLPDGTTCRYPQDTYEYAANASTVLRRTRTDYNMGSSYTNRRILGLPSAKYLCDGTQGEVPCNDSSGASLLSKVTFQYDETGSIQGNDAPVQHDNTNYTASFVIGRGNLSSVKRVDVINISQFTTNSVQYNTAGSVVKATDAAGHYTQASYADAFAANGTTLDSGLPATLAYPTTLTDADGYTSNIRYNYQFGAPTWKQTPLPNETTNQPGPQQKIEYYPIGRLKKVINLVNNAYTRFEYGPNYVETWSTVNTVADEAHALQVFDGHGRVIGKASNHPGSTGGFSGQLIIYNDMGRAIKQSNPTETAVTISGSPIQPYAWPAAGDDAQAGWLYTQQTYDWKGRPLVTTNTDLTTKIASYAGCGCAGGEVVTLTDEGTIDAGVVKRRQQKIYSDVLGRAWKAEMLNWEGGSVFSTTASVYNARDQVKVVNQYAGVAPTDASSTNEAASCPEGSCQKTTMAFDGYGRLQSKHVPEQNAGTATVYTYNSDDTIQSVTDARGASATFGYNNRHLVTAINYSAPAGITPTSNVTFGYDAVGNRKSMTDGLGGQSHSYDSLSRITSETRNFSGLGNYTLSYDYNLAGELKSITDPANSQVNYTFDSVGRPSAITGTNYGVSQFLTTTSYRASGSVKQASYGNGRTLSMTYNQRLQVSDLEMPGVMNFDYQFYADGSLKYSHDVLDQRFDRAYEYDHAARLKKGLSGAEARGEPANGDRPYYQTYTRDAFNHLTNRVTKHWSKNTPYISVDSYTNNRRNDWSYDAQGNLTDNVARQYGYDAAGQISFVSGSSLNQFFDGKGERVKTVEPNLTTYYIRSSVLGGQVIAELDGSGNRLRGFIYQGTKVLAEQWQNGQVVFVFADASAKSVRYTDSQAGTAFIFNELDPAGAEAEREDPYPAEPEYTGRAEGGALFPGFGNITDPSRGCTSNGIFGPCDWGFNPGGGINTAFWGYQIGDLPGFGTNWGSFAAQAEQRYLSLGQGFDPEFNRLIGTATVTVNGVVVQTIQNPTVDQYQQLETDFMGDQQSQTGYLPDSGAVDYATNTVTIFGGAEYFVTPQNTGQKKEPCPPGPGAPPGVSLDDNIRRAYQHRPSGPFTAYDDAKWFKSMVTHKAEWDYKRINIKYEDFGNFNLGATGSAIGFSLEQLLSEAGKLQAVPPGMKEKPKEWGYPAGRLWGKGQYPYGDEPKDAKQIEAGRSYYYRKFVQKDCQ